MLLLKFQLANVMMIPVNCPDYKLDCYLSKLCVHLHRKNNIKNFN